MRLLAEAKNSSEKARIWDPRGREIRSVSRDQQWWLAFNCGEY